MVLRCAKSDPILINLPYMASVMKPPSDKQRTIKKLERLIRRWVQTISILFHCRSPTGISKRILFSSLPLMTYKFLQYLLYISFRIDPSITTVFIWPSPDNVISNYRKIKPAFILGYVI